MNELMHEGISQLKRFEQRLEISNNVVCATSKASDQPAHTHSLIRAFASRLNILSVKLLTEHHFEFLSITGGCSGSSESTLVKMPHCLKSHVVANFTTYQIGNQYSKTSLCIQSVLHEASLFPHSIFESI